MTQDDTKSDKTRWDLLFKQAQMPDPDRVSGHDPLDGAPLLTEADVASTAQAVREVRDRRDSTGLTEGEGYRIARDPVEEAWASIKVLGEILVRHAGRDHEEE